MTEYAFQGFDKERMSRALGRDLAISTKQAIEICNYLRHRKTGQAKMFLDGAIEKTHAIPFKRFTNGLGHKPGKMAAGRYPVKSSRAFLKLIESVEANAQTKGFNTGDLEIIHLCAHKAARPVHHGRHQGREFKRTHVELVVTEVVESESKKGKKAAKVKAKTNVEEKSSEELKSDIADESSNESIDEKPTDEKIEEKLADVDSKVEEHDFENKEPNKEEKPTGPEDT